MYELKLLKLKETPVFSLADVSQIVSGKEYAKKMIHHLLKKGEIKKIMRNCYTFYDDSFLTAPYSVKPSYITSISALYYYGLITQIPNTVFCSTPKSNISIGSKASFFHTRYFFGFENKKYNAFLVPIATPEKAAIDSLGICPVSVFEEAMPELDLDKMIGYLKKIKKSSILKRIGFLMDRNGMDGYSYLKHYINKRYILLDPLAKKHGKKNSKWGVIVNA